MGEGAAVRLEPAKRPREIEQSKQRSCEERGDGGVKEPENQTPRLGGICGRKAEPVIKGRHGIDRQPLGRKQVDTQDCQRRKHGEPRHPSQASHRSALHAPQRHAGQRADQQGDKGEIGARHGSTSRFKGFRDDEEG
jgi:hypothetical protein